jgi:hypothetical protein
MIVVTRPASNDICTPLGGDAAERLDIHIRLITTTVRENLCKVSELVLLMLQGLLLLAPERSTPR